MSFCCAALWHPAPSVAAGGSIFIPGWGARARFYAPGLPEGWVAVDPPPFRRARSLEAFRAWLVQELERRPGPVALAGHSMGAALALRAAADDPAAVASLVLFAPAGLPLTKTLIRGLAAFAREIVRGRFPLRVALEGGLEVLRAPRAALRVGVDVRELDLSEAMEQVRRAGIPTTVVSALTDTMVTPAAARRMAELTGGRLVEVPAVGGHLWMFGDWPRFRAVLQAAASPAQARATSTASK
jgi:pimeloyl-ACP methyl ester carboxylesterase